MDYVVGQRETATQVGTPERALDQSEKKRSRRYPYKRRKQQFQKRVHVNALRRQEPEGNAQEIAQDGEYRGR